MFCPKCSQSQSSEEMRYCSRCGFPLEAVALLITHDGNLPGIDAKACSKSIRSRIATESVLLTVFSWPLLYSVQSGSTRAESSRALQRFGSFTFFCLALWAYFDFSMHFCF
jgi:hypothetical protein